MLGSLAFGRDGQGIGEDDFTQIEGGEPAIGFLREKGMREGEKHIFGAVFPYDIHRADDAAGGVDFIIDEQDILAFDAAD